MKNNNKKIKLSIAAIVAVILLIFGLSIYGSNEQIDLSNNTAQTDETLKSERLNQGIEDDEADQEKNEVENEEVVDEESKEASEVETEVTNPNDSQSVEEDKNSQNNEKQARQSSDSQSSEEEQSKNVQSNKASNNDSNQSKDSTQSSGQSSQASQSTQPQKSSQPSQPKPSQPVKPEPPVPQKTVSITITKGTAGGNVLSTKIPYQEGDTALDVSLRAMQSMGLSYSLIGSGAAAYMEGIDGLFEFDKGPLSGWKISVNGSDIDRSSGAYSVNSNDQITWYYTINYLED